MRKSGPAPFGYRRNRGRLVLDPYEAPIRQRMFALFLEHRRKQTVAEILNAEDHRTRAGKFFTGKTVSRLLSDEAVTGVAGKVDALITREDYDKCQMILAAQEKTGGAKRSTRHLFAGLIYCICSARMYVPTRSRKYVCRTCKAKIAMADLEAVFVEQLRAQETDPSRLGRLLDHWVTLPDETKRSIVEVTVDRIEIANSTITFELVPL